MTNSSMPRNSSGKPHLFSNFLIMKNKSVLLRGEVTNNYQHLKLKIGKKVCGVTKKAYLCTAFFKNNIF